MDIVLMALLLANLALYLIVSRDRRGERSSQLLLKFLLLGPLAAAWFAASKRMADDGPEAGTMAHNVARSFIAPWTIYLLLVPITMLGVAVAHDLLSGETSGLIETLAWAPLYYLASLVLYGIPVWVGPALLALVLARLTRPRPSG